MRVGRNSLLLGGRLHLLDLHLVPHARSRSLSLSLSRAFSLSLSLSRPFSTASQQQTLACTQKNKQTKEIARAPNPIMKMVCEPHDAITTWLVSHTIK